MRAPPPPARVQAAREARSSIAQVPIVDCPTSGRNNSQPGAASAQHEEAAMAMQKEIIRRGRNGHIIGTEGLSDMQAAFVEAYIANGGQQTEAARAAGYGSPEVRAFELMRHEGVQAAIAASLRPRMGKIGHLAATLIERELQKAIDEPDNEDAQIPIRELRALLASVADKLVVPAKADSGGTPPPSHQSIEEMEAELAALKRLASDAALLIDGETAS